MEKLLYKGALATFQCVTTWLLKIMVVYVESLQCGKVNYVNLNQLTVSFCTWEKSKGWTWKALSKAIEIFYGILRNGKIR